MIALNIATGEWFVYLAGWDDDVHFVCACPSSVEAMRMWEVLNEDSID